MNFLALLVDLAVAAAPQPSAPVSLPPPAAAAAGAQAAACEGAPAGMACIPGGPFYRGTDTGPNNAHPLASIWMQTYFMDIYEVTYGDYLACSKAKKCVRSHPAYNDYDRPKQPMVGMSWFDAAQFCKAQGKHLPSEAEWEKAARGPDGNTHPWGNEPAGCKRAVIMDKTGRGCGTPKLPPNPEKGRTLEVGTRPAGVYGLYDMSGNAWEWVADWYTTSFANCGKDCLGPDPKGPCGGKAECPGHEQKLVKGGSWYWPPHMATAVWRRPHFPANKPYHHFGFRCAASVAEVKAMKK